MKIPSLLCFLGDMEKEIWKAYQAVAKNRSRGRSFVFSEQPGCGDL